MEHKYPVPHDQAFDPRRAIIPIVEINSNREVIKQLGTGFYVGKKDIPVVVTAKHVFIDNPLDSGCSYGLVCYGDGKKYVADVFGEKFCDDFDVAAFNSSFYFSDCIQPKLLRGITTLNDDIFTFEYSPSRLITKQDGKQEVVLDAFTHKGNIMRYYVSDYPEAIPTPAYDTSFPALQGASGAPVIRAKDYAVVGMLVANYERHLVPAQVINIQHDNQESEKISYFLPTGKAIVSDLIIGFLESIGVSTEIVEPIELV